VATKTEFCFFPKIWIKQAKKSYKSWKKAEQLRHFP
jgi:hypothetical protein